MSAGRSRLLLSLAIAFIAVPASGAQVIWVGNQSDHNVLNGAASFHDGINWFNFSPPGSDDEAELGMSFDPQENGTLPHYLYFGAFQTMYAAPASEPLIPAGDAVVRSVVVYEGLDWAFDLGTNVVENIEGPTHGNLTAQSLYVGNPRPDSTPGHARLKLLGAGTVDISSSLVLGDQSGTIGEVIAEDGVLVQAEGVLIGHNGTGSLTIRNGGRVHVDPQDDSGNEIFIGLGNTGDGELIVRGAGSELTGSTFLTVGGVFHTATTGHGRLTISDGGRVENGDWGIVAEGNSSGVVIVEGPSSRWDIREAFLLAAGGNGTLNVFAGGAVSAGGISMAVAPSSIAVARVQGEHSLLSTPNAIIVGNEGVATLTVSDRAQSSVGSRLHIGTQGTVDVHDNGIVNVGLGDAPLPGTLRVGPGGTLAGSGEIIGDVLIDGGGVSPGSSPGALRITGNYNQLPGSVLSMEIAGTAPGSQYDQLLVTGNLSLKGLVQVSFINDFLPRVGDTFNLLGAGGTFVPPSSLTFLNAPPAFAYTSQFNNGVFSLTVTAVPEPAGVALLGLAIAFAYGSRRNPNAVHQRRGEGLRGSRFSRNPFTFY